MAEAVESFEERLSETVHLFPATRSLRLFLHLSLASLVKVNANPKPTTNPTQAQLQFIKIIISPAGSPLDGFCNGKAADQGYADPAGDCTKFILCDRSNRAARMTCGDNNQAPYGLLFYSVSDQRCERPAFSGCTPGQRQ